jgi:hypothetical protein
MSTSKTTTKHHRTWLFATYSKGMVVLIEPISPSNDANWKLTESNTYELYKRQQSWQNINVYFYMSTKYRKGHKMNINIDLRVFY